MRKMKSLIITAMFLAVLVLPILNAIPGPTTSNVQVAPNPTNCAATVTLTAKIDAGCGNVTGAEYFIDAVGLEGTGKSMNAQDGAFDSPVENVVATVDVTGLASGDHIIYVHGFRGCWGPCQSITLTVTCVNPIKAFMPVANYHLRQVNTVLGDIEGKLPEDIPEDIQNLLDDAQEHINNANKTGNSIYANNELLKALELLNEALSKL